MSDDKYIPYDQGPSFIDRLTLYQNANSSPEAIKRNFIIRVAEFEVIIADLRGKGKLDPVQHELILGRRGSGKSTLLRRIQIEIDEQPDLSEKYIAINLAEEQGSIYRLSDLWFEVLQELRIRFKESGRLRSFDSFKDNQEFARYLYGEIHRLLQQAGKRAVLLLDNLDRVLENFQDDAHLFRELLLNFSDVQLVGASTRMNEHFWRYDQPFYDFFRRHRLEGLTFEEIHRLLNHWSVEMDLPALYDYALRHRGRVEAIRILTDGLPRALQYFIQVLLHDSELYGFDYLKKVMDKATPLYQERLNNLTPPQRKIVQEMAFWWEAVSTKTLVEKCRMESKLIAGFLRQLDQFGIVETIPTGKKNHLYRLAERFFNMWLIVTQGNPDQKRRAKHLTLFLEGWYGEEELKALAQRHLEDLRSKNISFDKAMVLSKGLAQSKYIGIQDRDALIDLTKALTLEEAHTLELPRKASEILLRMSSKITEGKIKEALEKLEEIENEADGWKFFVQGLCFRALNQLKKSEMCYMEAIKNGNVWALVNVGVLYAEQNRVEEAEKFYLLAIEKGEVLDASNSAISHVKQNGLNQAEMFYLLTLEKCVVKAITNLANLYAKQNRVDQAEKLYLLAIEKGDSKALNDLANLYYNNNIKKQSALDLFLETYRKMNNESSFRNLVVAEIWNGQFEALNEKIEKILKTIEDEDLSEFLTDLLKQGQVQLTLSLFESESHGQQLRTRYELLYWAVLILAGRTENDLLLRIPPEVLPTVENIVKEVRETQEFYRVTN